MNNKNILTDKLGEIDSKFLDEYHDRRSRRALRRKNVMKYCSIAASVMIVITISLMAMLPAFRNTPAENPIDTSNVVIDNVDSNKDNPTNDNNKPDYSNYTFIYAEENDDYTLGDIVESEDVYIPPASGEVRFSGELYEIQKSDELYENTLFAVKISFGMDYTDEYYDLIAESKEYNHEYWDIYENEFIPHMHTHNPIAMDDECEECSRLYNAVESKRMLSDEAEAKAYKAQADMLAIRAERFIVSLGLEFKNVKVIWSDDPEKADESTEVWNVRITYLTKEQLASFEAPDDLGVELSLVPEWMDTEEEVIYRSHDLYPITLD